MKELKCPNKTRLLQEEILKELLSPGNDESKGICTVNEIVSDEGENLTQNSEESDKECMKLYIEESEEDDDNFEGSPLVRKMKHCMGRKSPETHVGLNVTESNIKEKGFSSIKDGNDNDDLSSPYGKLRVMLCEKCPLDRRQLNTFGCNNINEKVVMTQSDFNLACQERPEIKLCSVTICDKCTPCKEAQSVHVSAGR